MSGLETPAYPEHDAVVHEFVVHKVGKARKTAAQYAADPSIVAIAADTRPAEAHLPWFKRDDITGIANFIARRAG